MQIAISILFKNFYELGKVQLSIKICIEIDVFTCLQESSRKSSLDKTWQQEALIFDVILSWTTLEALWQS